MKVHNSEIKERFRLLYALMSFLYVCMFAAVFNHLPSTTASSTMPTTPVLSTTTSTTTPLPTTVKPTSYKDLDIPNYNVKSTTKKTSMFLMFRHDPCLICLKGTQRNKKWFFVMKWMEPLREHTDLFQWLHMAFALQNWWNLSITCGLAETEIGFLLNTSQACSNWAVLVVISLHITGIERSIHDVPMQILFVLKSTLITFFSQECLHWMKSIYILKIFEMEKLTWTFK